MRSSSHTKILQLFNPLFYSDNKTLWFDLLFTKKNTLFSSDFDLQNSPIYFVFKIFYIHPQGMHNKNSNKIYPNLVKEDLKGLHGIA